MLSDVIFAHHRCTFTTFLLFFPLVVSRMRKEWTGQEIIMIQLSKDTSHINNLFGAHNAGLVMGMLCVQHSGSYWIFFGTNSTHATPFDKYMAVALSVAHTHLHYSE